MNWLRQLIADLKDEPHRVARRIRIEVQDERRSDLLRMVDEGYSAEDIERYAEIRKSSYLSKIQDIRLAYADLLDRRGGDR